MAKKYVSRGGRELFASKAQFERWNDMPYGVWTCGDGREVVFNRFYEPLFQRWRDTTVQPADPREWVKNIVGQEWFYDDTGSEAKKRRAGNAVLATWVSPAVPTDH